MLNLGSRSAGTFTIHLLLPFLLIWLLFSDGCTSIPPGLTAEEFYRLWGKKEFAAMYELLDNTSRSLYPKEDFINRYRDITDEIGLDSVEIKGIEEIESTAGAAVFLISANLKTATTGSLPVQYRVAISRKKRRDPWRLKWHPGLIFPPLDEHSRVELKFSGSPRRGLITDRHGEILAGPRRFKEVGAVPGVYEDEGPFVTALEKLLKLDSQYILEQLHQPWVSEGLYVPLTVLAPEEEKLIDRLLQIPGVMINEVERRYYPLGAATAHLIGYLGEVTAQELEDNRGKGLHAGDLIGKTGLEATQEENLAGKRGYTLRILGADGGEAAVIAHQEPVDGQDVALSIDSALQKYAAEALGDRRGALVALDPRTGGIRALCSSPAFDPNRFIAGLSAAEWNRLQEEEAGLFLNRALSGIYPPGSVLKPLTAAAAIAEGFLDPEEMIEITGDRWQPDPSWGDYYIRRVRPDVEQLDLDRAMKYSDNIYFARAALALGKGKFKEYSERFGFTRSLPFPLPVALSRLAPDEIKSKIQLADSGYGQGQVMATPLQMALVYSAFAGEGSIPKPRLLQEEEAAIFEEAVKPGVAQRVHQALVEALHGAGAPSAAGRITNFKVAGKTGTAEIDREKGNICWYITYGPADSPSLVVAVVLEGGAMASTDALPVGRAVLKYHLLKAKNNFR